MAGLAREERGGVLVLPSVFTLTHRDAIIALAARHRLPAVYSFPYFAADGGLMSYGVDLADLHRRSAAYVDRILKRFRLADGGQMAHKLSALPPKADIRGRSPQVRFVS
jgi:putative ABC transport system substrate-binding protein